MSLENEFLPTTLYMSLFLAFDDVNGAPSPIVMRSPFRAKHHMVMQYLTAGLKCPLPPPWPDPCQTPQPNPPWLDPPGQTPLVDPPFLWTACSMTGGRLGGQGRIDEQGRIDDITTLQGTSHCSCLEHCFLFVFLQMLSRTPFLGILGHVWSFLLFLHTSIAITHHDVTLIIILPEIHSSATTNYHEILVCIERSSSNGTKSHPKTR